MDKWDSATPALLKQYLMDRGVKLGDKVLIYAHGASWGNVYQDLPFAIDAASGSGRTTVVALSFPSGTLSGEVASLLTGDPLNPSFWAYGPETSRQAGTLASLVVALNEITGAPPDAFGYSSGGVRIVKSLEHDVKYGTIELTGYPFDTAITPTMATRAHRILNFYSDSDYFVRFVRFLSPGFSQLEMRGAENYRMITGHGGYLHRDDLRQDFVKGLIGEDLRKEPAPSLVSPMSTPRPFVGSRRDPPFFPPPPPPGGGGAATAPRSLVSPWLTGDSAALPPDLAGVDFSSLQLNYFTQFSNGQASNLGYVFKAVKNQQEMAPVSAEKEATSAFDAFFVWLALSPDKFWVNLNPNEPKRIIDPELARTDAGRIMLEADFQMKKTVAKLIHPQGASGKAFWDQVYRYIEKQGVTRLCFSFRQWIVPGKVTVFATADSIYILDATLDVKLEAEYLKLKGAETTATDSCPRDIDPALQTYATDLFRKTILPELIEQVNTAPEYRDIRNIFHSRIIAEWYKTQHRAAAQAFADVIGRGKATEWHASTPWNPQELFNAYVQSVTQGEFNITEESQATEGAYLVTRTRTYFYGGVDFTRIETAPISYSALVAQKPNIDEQIFDALLSATGYWDASEVWLGGLYSSTGSATLLPTTTQAGPEAAPSGSAPPGNLILLWVVGAVMVVLLAWGAWVATGRLRT